MGVLGRRPLLSRSAVHWFQCQLLGIYILERLYLCFKPLGPARLQRDVPVPSVDLGRSGRQPPAWQRCLWCLPRSARILAFKVRFSQDAISCHKQRHHFSSCQQLDSRHVPFAQRRQYTPDDPTKLNRQSRARLHLLFSILSLLILRRRQHKRKLDRSPHRLVQPRQSLGCHLRHLPQRNRLAPILRPLL